MMLETHFVTFANIVFHPETSEGNSEDRVLGVQHAHQIDSAAIRQTEVAYEHIKLLLPA